MWERDEGERGDRGGEPRRQTSTLRLVKEAVNRYGNFPSCEEAMRLEECCRTKREDFVLPGDSCKRFVPDPFRHIAVGLRQAFAEMERPGQHFQKLRSVHRERRLEENALCGIPFRNSLDRCGHDEWCVPLFLWYIVEPAVVTGSSNGESACEDEHFYELCSAHEFLPPKCLIGKPLDHAMCKEEIDSAPFRGTPINIGEREDGFYERCR